MNKPNQLKTVQQKRIDILIRIALILIAVTILFFFVVKPMLKKDYYYDAGEEYKFSNLGSMADKDSFDVAVIGDGLDAVTGALGASRVGAKTIFLCPSKDLGDSLKKSQNIDWSADLTPNGNSVSSDLFKGIRYKAGDGSNLDNYKNEISKLLAEHKNLTVIYDAQVTSVNAVNGSIQSIAVKLPDHNRTIQAKRYIDGSLSGDLLKKCNVDFTAGYGDIGLDNLYQPVKLNFSVSGIDNAKVQETLEKQGSLVDYLLKSYKTGNRNIFISGLNIAEQGNGTVIIEAINMNGVDLTDDDEINTAYNTAKKECEEFYEYLKANLEEFKNSNGIVVADRFVMSSPYHFKGAYTMTLSDVLTGKRYTDRISTASRPVTFTMDDGNRYVLCNPKTFYIPLGSLIPEKLDNVLMTGDKISASSLVQTAIGSNSSKAGTGYAAGIIAAYSISKGMDIQMLVEDRNLDTQQEIEKILRKMGIYMSDVKEEVTSITGNWSYPYAEKLINLGLLSGGITNDYKYDKEAKLKDFAYIILNGVPRVSEEAYNYKFDITIRNYLEDEPLTKDEFGKIILELFHKNAVSENNYSEACKLGLIDKTLQDKIKNTGVLKLSDVYYSSVFIIEKLTGNSLK